jgi:hypothetical protein
MVAVFLHYGGHSSVPVKAEFKIRLVNQIQGKHDIVLPRRNIECARFARKFDLMNCVVSSRGFPSFVYRNVLNDECNGYKLDDCVVLEADITTFSSTLASYVTSAAPATFKAVRRQLFLPEPVLSVMLTQSSCNNKRSMKDESLLNELKAVDGMAVVELKTVLAARGLDATGLKAQLAYRLKAAIWSSAGNNKPTALPVEN